MFLTRMLLAKPKAKKILVWMESAVSGHKYMHVRERLADKSEHIHFDPLIQRDSVYREAGKIKSLRKRAPGK